MGFLIVTWWARRKVRRMGCLASGTMDPNQQGGVCSDLDVGWSLLDLRNSALGVCFGARLHHFNQLCCISAMSNRLCSISQDQMLNAR